MVKIFDFHNKYAGFISGLKFSLILIIVRITYYFSISLQNYFIDKETCGGFFGPHYNCGYWEYITDIITLFLIHDVIYFWWIPLLVILIPTFIGFKNQKQQEHNT